MRKVVLLFMCCLLAGCGGTLRVNGEEGFYVTDFNMTHAGDCYTQAGVETCLTGNYHAQFSRTILPFESQPLCDWSIYYNK